MDISGILSTAVLGERNASNKPAEEGFGFFDLLDVVNPLQHIPLVNNIYRSVTGDKIGGFANVVGGTLFGGPVGGGIALANEIVESDSGKNIVEQVFDAFTGSDSNASQTALAASKYEQVAENTSPNIEKSRATTRDWIYGGTFMDKA